MTTCKHCGEPIEREKTSVTEWTHYDGWVACAQGQAETLALPVEPAPTERSKEMTDAQIKRMVDRFLGWKLPENFNPDGGISFKKAFNEKTPWPMKNEPTGTNLFDATQAEEMIRYMLAEPSPMEGTLEAQPRFPDHVWIAAYIASNHAGVLSRGLYFRSIHDSEADAMKMKRDPATCGFEVQEYQKVPAPAAQVDPEPTPQTTELPFKVYRYGPNEYEFYFRGDVDAQLAAALTREQEKDGLITELRACEHTKAEEIVRKQTLLDEAVNEVTALRKSHDALLEFVKWRKRELAGMSIQDVGIEELIAAAEKLTGRKR